MYGEKTPVSAVERVQSRTRRVFYGWWIVAAGFGIQVLLTGPMMQAFGAYVPMLQRDFGWSKTEISAAFSLQRVESGMLGPVQGWLLTRFGPRNVMRVGIAMFGVGFMLFSQVYSLLTFYIVFFLMALGGSLSGFMAIITSLVNWFKKRRSTAIWPTGPAAINLPTPTRLSRRFRRGYPYLAPGIDR